MARPIDFIHSEIVRVSEELGKDPRTITRTELLKHADITKHDLEVFGGLAKLRADAAHAHGIEPIKDMPQARGVELRNAYVRSLERKVATQDYFSSKLKDSLQEIFEKNPVVIPTSKVKLSKKKQGHRLLTVLLSDLHFGIDVDSREVLQSEFNWSIAARRLAKLCHQAATWKTVHRDETELQVVLNGDILSGVIHLSEANLKPMTEQIWGATAILANALGFLRQHFGKISVLCLPGNHDRMTYRGTERAVSQRWDSYSHSVYLALKCYFRTDKDIVFDIPMSGMGTYTAPGGHLVYATHGDTEPGVGNVGKSFNVTTTTQSLMKLNSSGAYDKKVEVALFGHWHSPSIFMLPDGTLCIVNGCFAKGTKVLGPGGSKPIELVDVGDQIFSRDGTVQTVEATATLHTEETVLLRAKGLPKILECTPNHELWAIKGETSDLRRVKRGDPGKPTVLQEKPRWIAAENLSEGDWIHTPHLKGTAEADKDWLWTLGLFLAEGHTIFEGGKSKKHFRIEYSMHVRELPILERVKKVLDARLGKTGRIWTRPDRNTSHISYSGRDVSAEYREQFGHGAHNKKVPSWMFDLSPECRRAVVQGWVDGDGHMNARGQTSATTVSEELAWGMLLLAIGTGLEPMLYVHRRGEGPTGKSATWTIRFVEGQDVRWVNGERFLRLDYRGRSVDPKEVYDLRVSGEHTYTVEGFGVHNCLIGTDPYAQNGVGYFNSMPAQIMFESVAGHPVGDSRIVQLRDADSDAFYDSVIHIPGIEKGGIDFF